MRGTLERGGFARLAYRLGRGAATGELTIDEGPRRIHTIFLRRGYLSGARLDGDVAPLGQLLRESGAITDEELNRSGDAAAAGESIEGRELVRRGAVSARALDDALRRQAQKRLERLAAIAGAPYRFEPRASTPAWARGGRPISLTAWARKHIEARLDSLRARELATSLAGARLALRKDLAPDATECDDTDRRILEALTTPRRLDEIDRAVHAPRLRLLGFLWFLVGVGALEPSGVAAPAVDPRDRARLPPPPPAPRGPDGARRLLGVDASADADTIRRAYRRLAREWHPDRHPDAPPSTRERLEERFAALTDAYRTLTTR